MSFDFITTSGSTSIPTFTETYPSPRPMRDTSAFLQMWLEFRKFFAPVLLDNEPIIKDYELKHIFTEYGPSYELRLVWTPKKTQRRAF